MTEPELGAVERTSYETEINRNRRRTLLILAGLFVLTVLVGLAVDYLVHGGLVVAVLALVIAIVMAWVAYFKSDAVALAVSRARPADGPEFRRYHNLVDGLCIAAGVPKPRLFVVDDPAPNAFATGRDPEHAAIAVTTGLLATMNRVELEGVLAHELSHIKNYDILIQTVAVVAVGAIALMSDLGLRILFWSSIFGDDDDRQNNNPAGIVVAVLAVALLVLAPLGAVGMQFALSRRREYLADAQAVAFTRYPPGLASALRKLQADGAVVRSATKATAQMWIETPLDVRPDERGARLNRMFDTHPPLEERIALLEAM
ncbi:MAG: M48 family metalloprotease [Actinomycetes bacterium]